MLVPGFEVRSLPLELPNLVNLQYRHDGALVALGYNGNIWLLRDRDGDGLEDESSLFWEGKGKVTAPIGMDLAPAGSGHGDAVFFACKGKIMMVTDRDGDGVAEEERVLAEGWPLARAGIDAASICYDHKDGSIYFGLGVRWYDNAYEIDQDGVARNDLGSERGAILRIAPDFKSREKICTGIRWPIGLRFNDKGDLFCTDQEGATWLPNGNPFDELLVIKKDRHYGFPPRHPKHLPEVIDEPSVFDYGPQHQSTCGLRFNLPVNGGPVFGPDSWRGDALVVGESRGKIWRTKLVKTGEGYLAKNELIASLNQLAVDLTLSPRGQLLVATHSGEPDWGTGPEGKGHIFVIEPLPKSPPKPIAIWSAAADLFQVAWDRPLDQNEAKAMIAGATMTRGIYVRAGDHLESMWPGYEVVKQQLATPVSDVPILNGNLSEDARILSLRVTPQRRPEHYALSLPGSSASELHVQLTGIEAIWRGADGTEWRGWLPHPDGLVTRDLTAGSTTHLGLQKLLRQEGVLTLRTRLDLWKMLHPAIQPGATLDYEVPKEVVTVSLNSTNTSFSVRQGFSVDARSTPSKLGQISHDLFLTFTPSEKEPVDLVITLPTAPGKEPDLRLSWHTAEDARPRAMPLRRFLLPWAEPNTAPASVAMLARDEVKGGDWARGRAIFHSEKAQCGKCHQVRKNGGLIGPDLSNLVSRDYASTLRDIHDPSAVLNPDYLTHRVVLRDGREFIAVPRTSQERVILGLGAGVEVPVAQSEIVSSTALPISLMPPKLDEALAPDELRDLMAYLLTEPPLMGNYAKATPPLKRPEAEVAALLAGALPAPEKERPLKLLLVSGPKDHGPGEHDYPRWQTTWARLLSLAANTKIQLAEVWPTPAQWQQADAVIFYRKGDWSDERAGELDAFLARGGGAIFLHWAIEGGEQAADLAGRIGLASNSAKTKYRHGPVEWIFDRTVDHAIVRNFDKVHVVDETYWDLISSPRITPKILASSMEDNTMHPQCWLATPEGGGRVFVTLGGHYSRTFDDPLFRTLVFRGLAWSVNEPVDRFNKLVRAGIE
jgi:putative heme-binding domain-containing protein